VYQENARVVAFFNNLLSRVRALPGVDTAGLNNNGVLSSSLTAFLKPTPGSSREGAGQLEVEFRSVSSGYFPALRIPLLAGRYFDARVYQGASVREAIANQTLARALFGEQSPVGRQVVLSGWGRTELRLEIVGVVGWVRDISLESEPRPTLYVPYTLLPSTSMALFVRSVSDPSGFSRCRAWASLCPGSLPGSCRGHNLGANAVCPSGSPTAACLLFSGLAALSLVLALTGVYGVMSYMVTNRVREFGICMAMGASPSTLRWMVLRQSLLLTTIGAAPGFLLAEVYTRTLAALLPGIVGLEMVTHVLVLAGFLGAAVLASYIPARRAAALPPATILRFE
jgi:hypothetical protein